MGADLVSLAIEQHRLRRLEGPFGAPVLGLAGIDLHAVGGQFKQQNGIGRRRHQAFLAARLEGAADQEEAGGGVTSDLVHLRLHGFDGLAPSYSAATPSRGSAAARRGMCSQSAATTADISAKPASA